MGKGRGWEVRGQRRRQEEGMEQGCHGGTDGAQMGQLQESSRKDMAQLPDLGEHTLTSNSRPVGNGGKASV